MITIAALVFLIIIVPCTVELIMRATRPKQEETQ